MDLWAAAKKGFMLLRPSDETTSHRLKWAPLLPNNVGRTSELLGERRKEKRKEWGGYWSRYSFIYSLVTSFWGNDI